MGKNAKYAAMLLALMIVALTVVVVLLILDGNTNQAINAGGTCAAGIALLAWLLL